MRPNQLKSTIKAGLITSLLMITMAGKAQITLNTLTDSLYVIGPWIQQGTITYSNTQPRYTPAVTRFGIQLHTGTQTVIPNNIDITNLNGSPILGAHGSGTVLEYTGRMEAAGGRTFVSIAPINGGKVLIGAQARINLVLAGSYFTRQFWCYSDGTGAIEFDSAFVADRTNIGTIADGLGSIRLSKCNLITHSTKSLPKGYRPGNGGNPAMINAHLVFDDRAGSSWTTTTYPQEYVGGLWIQSAYMTVNTQTDLTLSGIPARWTDYTNWGGLWFQRTNAKMIKRGPAKLILSGAQGYADSSQIWIKDGTIEFSSRTFDPALASLYNSASASLPDIRANLHLTIDSVGSVIQTSRTLVAKSIKLISPLASYTRKMEDSTLADTVICAGRLNLTFKNGVIPFADFPKAYQVFSSPNILGQFDSLNLPNLSADPRLTWDTDSLYITGVIKVSVVVGQERLQLARVIRSWPNPASNTIYVSLPAISNTMADVTWLNAKGQVCRNQITLVNDHGSITLLRAAAGSMLPNGLYQVLIKAKGELFRSQVIWQ